MDRKTLKSMARASVAKTNSPFKAVTLVLLLSMAALIALELGFSWVMDRTGASTQTLSRMVSAQTRSYAITMGVGLIAQAVWAILRGSYAAMALKLCREEEFSMDVLLEGFRIWTRIVLTYFYISLLEGLWASLLSFPVSSVLSTLGLAAGLTLEDLVIPMVAVAFLLIFIVSYRYRMATFVLMDGPEKPIRQIVTEARLLGQTHRVQLFLLDLSFLPWILLSALTGGILLIWKLPYLITTYAHAYHFFQTDYQVRQKRLEEFLARQREQFQQNWNQPQ